MTAPTDQPPFLPYLADVWTSSLLLIGRSSSTCQRPRSWWHPQVPSQRRTRSLQCLTISLCDKPHSHLPPSSCLKQRTSYRLNDTLSSPFSCLLIYSTFGRHDEARLDAQSSPLRQLTQRHHPEYYGRRPPCHLAQSRMFSLPSDRSPGPPLLGVDQVPRQLLRLTRLSLLLLVHGPLLNLRPIYLWLNPC